MAIVTIRNKINRIETTLNSIASGGQGCVSTLTEVIDGRIIKIALVSEIGLISGNLSVKDFHTREDIWNKPSLTFTTNPVLYPRISGQTSAGVGIGYASENEVGFPTSKISIAMNGVSGATGIATCYIYYQ